MNDTDLPLLYDELMQKQSSRKKKMEWEKKKKTAIDPNSYADEKLTG